ncbi:YdcF family protein [Paenibacillus pinistramenti]|uniref:YdcF family protein n=1 Tax=Paenibacillus pinistramenti TaxID=1768003 RepID=UPI0011093691|nr:YdcF family protein [Paenibacillus pinistramenti]
MSRRTYQANGLAAAGRRSLYKSLAKGAGLLILLLAVWLAYAALQVESERSKEPAEKADVGIVLGAALWDDKPSPGLEERLERAVQDYRNGKFSVLIVTGGLDTDKSQLTEAEGMAEYLESKGIPADRILLENKATDTYENLLYSQRIMEEHNLKTAIIITHDFHGRRSLEIARALDYKWPQLSLMRTKVMNEGYYKIREVLAYTKWKLQLITMAVT